MILLLYLSIVSTIFYVVQTHPSSDYSETKIITDTCKDNEFLLSTTTHSSLDCGISCGENAECRRFVFCSSKSTCTLYQHGTDCIISGDSTSCTCYRKNIGRNADDTTTCAVGFYGNNCQNVAQDCKDAYNKNIHSSFQIKDIPTYIKPTIAAEPVEVKCGFGNGGSTLLMHRKRYCSFINFNRSTTEYEQRFGNFDSNYWIGFNTLLDIMLGSPSTYRLQIMVFNTAWIPCSIYYEGFQIGNKSSGYSFGSSSTTPSPDHADCGDSMTGSLNLIGNPFSTYDDDYTGVNQCANRLGGGWWFEDSPQCSRSFLTGTVDGSTSDTFWLDNLDGELLNMVKFVLTK
ncbi:angiopoietin-4 [Patella vulgata]|uniref:angiopoietin-4 n=1 Tax=Patella vulgata TaxID=6465 RepID=UPI00218094F1|nr:angiopoietin-4 [Patella vulgata]